VILSSSRVTPTSKLLHSRSTSRCLSHLMVNRNEAKSRPRRMGVFPWSSRKLSASSCMPSTHILSASGQPYQLPGANYKAEMATGLFDILWGVCICSHPSAPFSRSLRSVSTSVLFPSLLLSFLNLLRRSSSPSLTLLKLSVEICLQIFLWTVDRTDVTPAQSWRYCQLHCWRSIRIYFQSVLSLTHLVATLHILQGVTDQWAFGVARFFFSRNRDGRP
jgi:hypothetical protein